MSKITRFQDIPQFVREGSYQINVGIDYIEHWLRDHQKPGCGEVLNLDPDFQRGHIWTPRQQKAWLEYLFRGGRSGRIIYFNHPGWQGNYQGDFVLVDGKQRLEAIRRFLANEIKVFGSYFREFTDKPRMSNGDLLFNINTLRTRAEVLSWYLQMNFGGTPHPKKELDRVLKLYEKETGRTNV
jgi:hypothetical protein